MVEKATISRFRHQGSKYISILLPKYFPTCPAAMVEKSNHPQMPPPGSKFSRLLPIFFLTCPQQWWKKATRQLNKFQDYFQYSSQPVLQQWFNKATIS
jgi:hypothetical protein